MKTKRILKKVLSAVLAVAIIFGATPLSGFKGVGSSVWNGLCSLVSSAKEGVSDFVDEMIEETKNVNITDNMLASSGQCGDNVSYTFNSSIGLLTISGTGKMKDYSYSSSNFSPFYFNSSIKSVVIENGVTSIGSSAFYYCTSLQSITIPDSVTYIGSSAFYECTSLQSVAIPDSVKSIGYAAFYKCTKLQSITIPDSVTSIGDYAFEFCTSLQSITIPDSVTSIGGGAFSSCDSLQSITIPDSVTSIGDSAFSFCDSLQSITIPDSVASIGDYAFEFCERFQSVTIPDSVTSIGDYAFRSCTSLQNITIGNGVTSIGDNAFRYCTSLQSITVDANNKYYSSDSYGVLYNKDRTELIQYPVGNERISFTVPSSVTSIGEEAFYHCTSLKSVTIPDSVTSIGDYAFYDCTSLQNITIGNGVTSIGDNAFRYCTSLQSITVDTNNQYYSSDSYGVLYNKDKTELIQYPVRNKRTSFTIPDSVTSIGDYAFYKCTSLQSVTIPDSVKSIGHAFFECRSLQSVTIGNGVTSIGYSAFWYCTSLQSVTIGNGVTSIGSGAFEGCVSLKDVYYSGTQEQWGRISIGNYNSCLTSAFIHFPGTPEQSKDEIVNGSQPFYQDGKKGTVDFSFNSSWFANDSSIYNHNLAQLSSEFITLGYDDAKPMPNDFNTGGIYGYKNTKPNLYYALTKIGFYNVEISAKAEKEHVNYFFAERKIHPSDPTNKTGKEYRLIFIGLIGSYQDQWYSNFDPGTGDTHKGFASARDYILGKLANYMGSYDKSSTKFLICGHSRGAATSNLVAANLIKSEKYATKENIYTYAFATPNSTTLPERNDAKFKRIFNIVNPEDFVTNVMPVGWNYGRYGTTYTLPSKSNVADYSVFLNNMQEKFKRLSGGERYVPYAMGEFTTLNIVNLFKLNVPSASSFYNNRFFAGNGMSPYEFLQNTLCVFAAGNASTAEQVAAGALMFEAEANPYALPGCKALLVYFVAGGKLDEKFVDAHRAETYCAYVTSMTERHIKMNKNAINGYVNCPVDIEIYDKETGELVGRIVDNVVDETVASKENSVTMFVNGESKQFLLPADGDFNIKLIGNDDGTMDYSISELGEDFTTVQKLNFFDVKIENGKTYTADVSSEEELDEYTITSPTGEEVEPSENMTNEEIVYYNITTSVEGNGIATESMSVESGSYVTLTAEPDEGNTFIGWYDGSTLISSEKTYSFVAKGDVSYKAKFEAATIKSVKIDDITINYKSSQTLKPVFDNDAVQIKKIEFSSSDTGVATVDNNGKVYGAKRGEATITCKVTDESGNTVSDTCKVTVSYAWWQWLIKILLFGWIWY